MAFGQILPASSLLCARFTFTLVFLTLIPPFASSLCSFRFVPAPHCHFYIMSSFEQGPLFFMLVLSVQSYGLYNAIYILTNNNNNNNPNLLLLLNYIVQKFPFSSGPSVGMGPVSLSTPFSYT